MVAPVQDRDETIRRILSIREELVALGVADIGLFGSFAAGRVQPTSDVDILLELAPDRHSFDAFMDVAFLLEDVLGRKVEVVTRDALSPHIGPHILREVLHVPLAA